MAYPGRRGKGACGRLRRTLAATTAMGHISFLIFYAFGNFFCFRDFIALVVSFFWFLSSMKTKARYLRASDRFGDVITWKW
jgi:hypothetical protein